MVERFPNVSALDLAEVQRTVEGLLSRLEWAVRVLAMFSVAAGCLVLLGALAASRLERLREAVLLKTLGGPAWVARTRFTTGATPPCAGWKPSPRSRRRVTRIGSVATGSTLPNN